MSITTHCLGLPRIGPQRELKFALERYWSGKSTAAGLLDTAATLEHQCRQWQVEAGLELVTVGDFCLYDHVLDTSLLLGNVPARFQPEQALSALDREQWLNIALRMARGRAQPDEAGVEPCEMTKWFDSNYHYLVPEFTPDTRFQCSHEHWFERIAGAASRERVDEGQQLKVVLLGPVSYLYLGKEKTPDKNFSRLSLLAPLLQCYAGILQRLQAMNIDWVQIDEPVLSLDLAAEWQQAIELAYHTLQQHPRILLTTGFGALQQQLSLLSRLPVAGVHLDAVRSNEFRDLWSTWPAQKILSLGVIDGRNIWRTDTLNWQKQLQPVHAELGSRLWLGTAGSLLHVPVSLAGETAIAATLLPRLSFAREKLHELAEIKALLQAPDSLLASASRLACEQRRQLQPRVHGIDARAVVAPLRPAFAERYDAQLRALALPVLPTTTIGSFPQTDDIRKARADFKAGRIVTEQYEQVLRAAIAQAIQEQEQLGLDVLVHGEAERNDMVEYFAEQLQGYAVTQQGWVQSYGSRCVKPPLIHDDVLRPQAMTVRWIQYAQSLTPKPVKGMLTGPVTMLGWSFVRDDLPRSVIACQIADAIREEVLDLERAGVRIIQIDEPAFREGLPLRQAGHDHYWQWAVNAFRQSYAGIRDDTQIHTHMCYSDFNDCLPVLAAMDADVITIECARSGMELLDAFARDGYPNAVGPGLYDIHTPLVPENEEMAHRLIAALKLVPLSQLWVNPDCGLKTRQWPETRAALSHMVQAAQAVRAVLARSEQPAVS